MATCGCQALGDTLKLARTRVTSARGADNDAPFADSTFSKIFLYGGRGFAIHKADPESVSLVYSRCAALTEAAAPARASALRSVT